MENYRKVATFFKKIEFEHAVIQKPKRKFAGDKELLTDNDS
jgi:hypothetical protein